MITSPIKQRTAVATVLAAAAFATPASAAPVESMLPNSAGGSSQQARTVEAAHTVTITSPGGFDWADAGIGAGAALCLLAVGAGSAVTMRRGLRATAS